MFTTSSKSLEAILSASGGIQGLLHVITLYGNPHGLASRSKTRSRQRWASRMAMRRAFLA